jgi:hypothetical protein
MIVEAVASGRTTAELLADFPYLEAEDITEALTYAAMLAQGREVQLASYAPARGYEPYPTLGRVSRRGWR